jgi:hypothetical protein
MLFLTNHLLDHLSLNVGDAMALTQYRRLLGLPVATVAIIGHDIAPC